MSGLRSRRKGHSFEREMAIRFRDVFGDKVRRGLQSRSGEEVPDVETPMFWIECKRGKRTNPKAALKQAISDCGNKGKIPIAICRDDREDATVMIGLEDFIDLASEWWTLRERHG